MKYFFKYKKLINSPPIKRAAYSDRTAWIMAEFSRLVYERLPNEHELDNVLDLILSSVKKNMRKSQILPLVEQLSKSTRKPIISKPEAVINELKYNFIRSHTVLGTEVMVIDIPANSELNFAGMFVIAFRGTEADSVQDIKTDISAPLVQAPGGGRIHKGFLSAYKLVEDLLIEDIKQAGEKPIYITGHSLGGALAMVATRYIGKDSIGATYTFGCPRVADDTFYNNIKTPVYRVVNAADGVTRIPFGAGFTLFLSGLRMLPFNGTKYISELLRKHIDGYTHYGHLVSLSSLSPTKSNPYKGLQVIHSPNIFRTGLRVVPRMIATCGKAAIEDHSIEYYCEKLAQHALSRFD